jgi:hypothetical protein
MFSGRGAVMDATLEDVTRKKKLEPTPERQAVKELVRRPPEQGLP